MSSSVTYAKTNTAPNTYTLDGAGDTQGNGVVVKVTVISNKKDNVKAEDIERAAVHGVLFRGYATKGVLGNVDNMPSLMPDAESETVYADFFAPFFSENQFKAYVQSLDETRRVVKYGKQFMISCNVVVQRDPLRRLLEKKGFIRRLGEGF